MMEVYHDEKHDETTILAEPYAFVKIEYVVIRNGEQIARDPDHRGAMRQIVRERERDAVAVKDGWITENQSRALRYDIRKKITVQQHLD